MAKQQNWFHIFMMALAFFFFRYATLSVRILKLERAMRDGFRIYYYISYFKIGTQKTYVR